MLYKIHHDLPVWWMLAIPLPRFPRSFPQQFQLLRMPLVRIPRVAEIADAMATLLIHTEYVFTRLGIEFGISGPAHLDERFLSPAVWKDFPIGKKLKGLRRQKFLLPWKSAVVNPTPYAVLAVLVERGIVFVSVLVFVSPDDLEKGIWPREKFGHGVFGHVLFDGLKWEDPERMSRRGRHPGVRQPGMRISWVVHLAEESLPLGLRACYVDLMAVCQL